MNFNYSVEISKKSAFVDELNNRLKIYKNTDDNEIIIRYLEKRIKEINEEENKMLFPN
jgi:hypothetical protein